MLKLTLLLSFLFLGIGYSLWGVDLPGGVTMPSTGTGTSTGDTPNTGTTIPSTGDTTESSGNDSDSGSTQPSSEPGTTGTPGFGSTSQKEEEKNPDCKDIKELKIKINKKKFKVYSDQLYPPPADLKEAGDFGQKKIDCKQICEKYGTKPKTTDKGIYIAYRWKGYDKDKDQVVTLNPSKGGINYQLWNDGCCWRTQPINDKVTRKTKTYIMVGRTAKGCIDLWSQYQCVCEKTYCKSSLPRI